VRWEPHAGCGGRAGETHQEQSWQGAPVRPNWPQQPRPVATPAPRTRPCHTGTRTRRRLPTPANLHPMPAAARRPAAAGHPLASGHRITPSAMREWPTATNKACAEGLKAPISSDTRVIISAYLFRKIERWSPVYLALYVRRAWAIFDHPYNAESARLTCAALASAAARRIAGSGING